MANLEQSKIYKVMKGPNFANVLDVVEDIDLDYLGINQQLCPNNRYTQKICNTCERFCPVGAIGFEKGNGIIIDEKKCIQCGICGPVCPNGVFEPKLTSDEKVFSDIFNILGKSKTKNIRFDCTKCHGYYGKIKRKRKKKETLLLPCLGSISELYILWAYALGAKKISYRRCDDKCQYTQGKRAFKRTRILIEHLVNCLNIKPGSNNLNDYIVGELSNQLEDEGTRRDFFINLGKKTAKVFEIGNEEDSEELEFWHQQVPKKRLMLLNFTDWFGSKGYISKRGFLPFAEPIVDRDRCDLCEVCTYLCPTGALRASELDNIRFLYFTFGKCTGCGLCERGCPNRAILMNDTVDLGMLSKRARVLVKHRTESCPSCMLTYIKGRLTTGDCPQCGKRESIRKGVNDALNSISHIRT